MKTGPCSWALHALALCPALAYLTDSPSAAAATQTCSGYSSCVSHLQSTHASTCAEARREDKNASCPPLTSQYIAQVCGPAPNCAPVSGTVTPKFIVTNVVYAPPGSANKGGGSNVDYGSSSTTGVTTSVGSSFKSDYGISASLSLSDPVALGISLASEQFTVSTSTSSTSGSQSSLDVKKATGYDLKVPGPATDGVDHDYDEIWVLLNPVVGIVATGNTGHWVVGMNSRTVPQYAKVAWLKNPSSMPANVAQAFANAGCTTADYATMLARDPFADVRRVTPPTINSEPAAPDPTRFTLLDEIPYEPDATGPTQQYSLKNDTTATQQTTNNDSYTVGMSFSASAGLADWIKLSLTATSSWTWTDTSSSSNSQDQTQSASATIASPSPAYGGTVDMQIYWDGVYGTFLFVPYNASNPILTGVVEAMNRPVPGADVVITVGNHRVHAYADRHGVYRVSGLPAGSAQITYGGNTQTATVGRGTVKVNFGATAPSAK
ncbi:MAG TPA: carboxypeptidase-like regulatory domain-containing protein [Polyangiaceae bacterium]|nr:carboxypeptidase-like regulatory domain-containing protein [Polyangiaceae bacterium]